jgi:hypothetical protein
MRTRCDDHMTTIYTQKLAQVSPTSGGRPVDMVRLQTESHGVCLINVMLNKVIEITQSNS